MARRPADPTPPSGATPAGPPPEPSGVEIAPGVRVPERSLEFTYSSASGPGGQNVNRRATRAQLRLRLDDVPISARARERLASLASHWLAEGDVLLIACDEHRSQSRNRQGCLDRLRALVVAARTPPRPRIATRPSRGSVERRLEAKRRRSRTKTDRRDPE